MKRPASYRQSANFGNASKGDLVVATQSLNRASNTTNNISSAPTSAASENSNGAILHEIVRTSYGGKCANTFLFTLTGGQGGADWRMYAGNSRPKSYLELLDIDDQDNEETRRTDRLLRLERSLSVKSNTSAHNVTLTRQPSTKRISSSFNRSAPGLGPLESTVQSDGLEKTKQPAKKDKDFLHKLFSKSPK